MKKGIAILILVAAVSFIVGTVQVQAQLGQVEYCNQSGEHEHNICGREGCNKFSKYEYDVCVEKNCTQSSEHYHNQNRNHNSQHNKERHH